MDKKKSPLLNKGADVNVLMNDGVSPLCITSQKRHYNIMQLLFPSCANFHICYKNNTISLYAACFGDIAVLHSFYSIIGEMLINV